MQYYWCHCADSRNNILVTHRLSKGRLVVAPEYQAMSCPKCLYVDESAALASGIAPFEFATRYDYIASSDGFLCVSPRVKKSIEKNGFKGLQFYPVKTTTRRTIYLAVCTIAVPADAKRLRCADKCSKCGRWGWTGNLPHVSDIQLPDDPKTLFQLDLPRRFGRGRDPLPYSSEVFVQFMGKKKFTGFGGVRLEP